MWLFFSFFLKDIYIYMYVYIYRYIYIRTHTHTHIYIDIHTHTHIYIYIYNFLYNYLFNSGGVKKQMMQFLEKNTYYKPTTGKYMNRKRKKGKTRISVLLENNQTVPQWLAKKTKT